MKKLIEFFKIKDAIFIVESPLQLLNAYEALKLLSINNYYLIVRLSKSGVNDEQILKLFEVLNINRESTDFITINASSKKVGDYFKILYFKIIAYFFQFKFKKMYVGSFYSRFILIAVKNFCMSKLCILDDGNASIRLFDNQKLSSSMFFSSYIPDNLKSNRYINNEYLYTKSFVGVSNVTDDDSVLFLGSGLAEINIIDEEKYFELFLKIVNYFQRLELKVTYIPHRVESPKKLSRISKINNVTVKNIDYPVELFGYFYSPMPNTICSFYSSALISMKSIYTSKVISFKFDYSGNLEFRDEIESVYRFYQKTITVIDVEDL